MSQVGKIIIDFQVFDLENPQVLIVEDTSIWLHIENSQAIIEILMPGSTVPLIYNFNKNRRTVFNSALLVDPQVGTDPQAELSDLPDGIYTITVKGSPSNNSMERKFLKTSQLEVEFKKLFVTQGLECKSISKDFLNLKLELDLYIKAAKANIVFNNDKKAFELYNRAYDLLENLKRCKPCAGVGQ